MSNHGLTADNMMQQFPIALQKDPKTVALGQAIAKVMESRQDEIDSLRIYTRIDELPEWLLDILARDFAVDWYDRSYTLEEKEKPSRTASMFTGTVAQKRLLKEPFLRFIPIPKFWSGLSTAAIRTTSNSVSRLISLQSMRPNISRFCKNHLLQKSSVAFGQRHLLHGNGAESVLCCSDSLRHNDVLHGSYAGCYRAAGSQCTRLRRWYGQHNSDENDHCAARNYPRQGCVCTGACIWQTFADL